MTKLNKHPLEIYKKLRHTNPSPFMYFFNFKDFNEASFGSLMLDTVAYIGDMLSFYIDYQANESFIDSAIETKNILKLAIFFRLF